MLSILIVAKTAKSVIGALPAQPYCGKKRTAKILPILRMLDALYAVHARKSAEVAWR
jgi:hypothetical protein